MLIDFSPNLNLNVMNQDTLARKATDTVNTTWAITPKPKPSSQPKIKAATLMCNGGLLLEFDSVASVRKLEYWSHFSFLFFTL